jgi:hypothetical protein
MPDWSKIKKLGYEVNGVSYATWKEAQRALGGAQRTQNTTALVDTMKAASPNSSHDALAKLAEALAEKFIFSDRAKVAEAARKRRAKKSAPADGAPPPA